MNNVSPLRLMASSRQNREAGQVIPLHGADLAKMLRALADRAEAGEFIGGSVVVRTHDRKFEFYNGGIFKGSSALAHAGACQLADRILYQEGVD